MADASVFAAFLALMDDHAHPVGSQYVTFEDDDPADLFGGEWRKLEDVFVLASGKRDADARGGAEEVALAAAHMPAHKHTSPQHTHSFSAATAVAGAHFHRAKMPWGRDWVSGHEQWTANSSKEFSDWRLTTEEAGAHAHSVSGTTRASAAASTGSAGAGQAHDNMPPYVVRHVWERRA